MNTIRSSALLIAALALPSLGPLTAAAGVSSISEPASQSIIIHCGSLIDGLSETVLGAREVRVDKGVITALDNASRTVVAERDIDLRDYTCLPGLINTHVHFDANPEDAADYGIYARRSTRTAARHCTGRPAPDIWNASSTSSRRTWTRLRNKRRTAARHYIMLQGTGEQQPAVC